MEVAVADDPRAVAPPVKHDGVALVGKPDNEQKTKQGKKNTHTHTRGDEKNRESITMPLKYQRLGK